MRGVWGIRRDFVRVQGGVQYVGFLHRIQYFSSGKRPKRVLYDIAPKKGVDKKTDDSVTFRNREAEIYVFCLLDQKDVTKIDVLDLNQWKFYIVRTTELDEDFQDKKKIGIRPLNQLASPVHHSRIKAILDDIIELDLGEKMVL